MVQARRRVVGAPDGAAWNTRGMERLPEKDQPPELVAERQRAMRWIVVVMGVGIALLGSYNAVQSAFDNDVVCLPGDPPSCITFDDTQDIWLGLVMTVVGAFVAYRSWRKLNEPA